ncbi:MAG: extracellular solute-binding protein [Actinomycetota bacterium]|jgi:iron(III) transport system substrate-binding protein|nr:extracellular solute-binding protein [Actinomycetota bacterium]
MTPETPAHPTTRGATGSRSRRLRRVVAVLATVAAGGALAACGSSASASSASSTTSATPVPLVVYAAEGYDQAEVTAFQKATGIPTKLVDHSTGTLLAKISAERNNPQWGVFWSDGAEAYAALDQQHMLVRGFEPTAGTLNALGKEVVPVDKSYVPTGLTIAAAVIYNSNVVKNPPTNWTQLLEPQWKGAVGMNNPAISGPTYPFVAGVMEQLGGVSQGEQFFTKLKANGLHVYSTNKVTLTALLNGTIKLALVQNSAGIGFQFKAPQLKVAYPAKVSLLPGVIGIDAKAPKQEIAEAERFANFVYSPKGQAVQLSGDPHGDSLFFPVVKGTTPLPQVPDLASLPTQNPNPTVWGPREANIDQWFTNNIVQ